MKVTAQNKFHGIKQIKKSRNHPKVSRKWAKMISKVPRQNKSPLLLNYSPIKQLKMYAHYLKARIKKINNFPQLKVSAKPQMPRAKNKKSPKIQ